MQLLRSAGGAASKLAHLGLAPAINYGVSINGRSDTQVEKARSLIGAAAFTTTAGRSLTLSYLLHPTADVDPVFSACRGPIIAWATAV